MICIKTCLLSTVLLFWVLSGMLVNKKTKVYTELINTFSEVQKTKLDEIIKERTSIFKKASCVSVIISLCITVWQNLLLNIKGSNNICKFIVSYVFFMSLVYMIHPKSDYMIRHLRTQDQRNTWVKLKKEMSLKRYMGIGIGLFVYSLFSIIM